jgi:hypothetical protein
VLGVLGGKANFRRNSMGFSTVVRKVFPFISIAASMGGPLGTMAAGIVGKALGMDKPPAATADGITTAIAGAIGDPVQRAALQKAETDFQAQMAELGYKDAEALEATDAADRASARVMATQTHSLLPAILAVAVTLGFFGLLALMAYHAIPLGAETMLNVMTGSLGTAWIMIITFYFGSSAGSDRKTEILAAATTAAKP